MSLKLHRQAIADDNIAACRALASAITECCSRRLFSPSYEPLVMAALRNAQRRAATLAAGFEEQAK